MMLTHSEAQALISASLDNPLDEDIEQILADHLAGCEECRIFAASSQRLANALASMPTVPASPAVRQAVWARIEQPEPWWSRIGEVASGRTAAMVSTAVIALLIIAFAALAIARLTGNDNGDNGGTRLAAGTQEAIALATATAAPTATVPPTATLAPTETPVPPTETQPAPTATTEAQPTQAPPTETPVPPTTAPETVAPTDVPVDLTGGGQPTSTVVATAQVAAAQVPTETPVTPTQTPVPPTATATPTDTPVPPTETAAPTETPVPTETPSPTATPAPTETPVPEPGNLTVSLTDQDGNPVPDACFALLRDGDQVAQSCDTADWETAEFASNGNTGFFDIPAGAYTLHLVSLPEDVAIEDRKVEIPPGGDDVVTIDVEVATPAPEPTATPAPTETPQPIETPVPTSTPEPTATAEPPTATPAPPTATEEATSPPIEPIDGQPVVTGQDTPAPSPTEATEQGPSQQIVAPAQATQAAGGGATTEPQVIEPIGGQPTETLAAAETPETPQVVETPETPQVTAATEAPATVGAETPVAGTGGAGVNLADAPFYSDGQLWGDATARLAWQDGQIVFTSEPDGFSLEHPTLTVQSQTEDGTEYLAVCQDGACVDATRDSGDGTFTDAPIGWIGDRLLYQRSTGDGPLEIRALTWDTGAGAPADDSRIGTLDQPFSPLGRGYEAQAGTLIPGTDAWLLVTDGEARVIDGNPYGDVQLVRTAFADPLIAYVAGGQLVVAPQDAPGSPTVTIPFAGVDFDISPQVDRIVVSTGTGLEIYGFDGQLQGRSATNEKTGSVVWLSGGIVFIDRTTTTIRLIDPAALTG